MVEALPERIEKFISPEPNSGCWLWTGARFQHGDYGAVRWNGRAAYAHRVVYELAREPIPPGLTLDHLCRVRACVNPAHLEAVTMYTNAMRGVGVGARKARQVVCPRGHVYDVLDGLGRRCSICRNETGRQRRARVSAEQAALPGRPCLCGCGAEVRSSDSHKRPTRGLLMGHYLKIPGYRP
ncbi:MAG: HNH endonuclease [Chloroflexi bacterium]|nr:MAG: HNH endonuclease [Chloroflexota bacterium]